MAESAPSRVRERREACGLSQMALAAAAQLTRQSIGAIEAGKSVPAVDVALRIATALDCKVEDLFARVVEEPTLVAEPWGVAAAGRVALAQIAGRWVTYPLAGRGIGMSADGLAGTRKGLGIQVEPLRAAADIRENLVVMGCATALGLLADRLNARPGPGRFIWIPTSSTKALDGLAKRQTHIAGVHLVDARSGESNLTDVRRYAAHESMVLVTLARWEAGLVVAAGNPKRLRHAEHLGRRGLRLVSREPGSGARRLFDRELRAAGLSDDLAKRSTLQATGHIEVAQTIAIGAGDVGIGTRDVAIAFGLEFIPLAEERYDLVIPLSFMRDPRVQRFFDAMTASTTRRELEALGYDVRCSGDRVAEVHAA